MDKVFTPDGWGQVLRTESTRGKTSYLVKGSGFEGWYDGLQVQADFADQPDDIIPNEDNNTVLPYPSRAEGPGWDGSTSTIQPDIDPHLDLSGNSDSLTGDPTDEDAVGADLDGLFEPHSRLAHMHRRVHFAGMDDPILDVSAIPEESPTGLDNSPINPDSVNTDDLFDGSLPHFEREGAVVVYDKLVIASDLSFLKYAEDNDDKKKKNHREQDGYSGFPKDDDDDDSDDKDDDDSDDSSSSDDGDSDGDGDGGGGHTAAVSFALTTTADLHFLANVCHCAETLPLHSKSEHLELLAEAAADVNGITPQPRDLDKLHERYLEEDQLFHPNPLDLVDHSTDADDNADLYNHYASVSKKADGGEDGYDKYIGSNGDGTYHLIASGGGKLPKGQQYGHYDSHEAAHDAVRAIIERNHSKAGSVREVDGWLINEYGQAIPKTAAPAADPNSQPTQIESQIEQLMQFWAVDNNGWWHWTGSQADLALLNQMQQQMMAVGMPGGPPGQMQAQSSHEPSPYSKYSSFHIEANTPAPWRRYLQTVASDRLVALAAWKDVVQKSKRLRAEGAIDLEVWKPDVITAYIQGDNGRYYTTVQRLGAIASGVGRQLTSTQVSGWSCECEWGHWAWLRKRSFVGRMCSHAYALFSEMRSLDAKSRREKGKPLSAGKFASVSDKTSWTRTATGGFEWVSSDLAAPTAVIAKTATGWNAHVWSDGTAQDSLDVGVFSHSEQARRAISRIITAHIKLADEGDIDMVGGPPQSYAAPDSIPSGIDDDPYTEDGSSEPMIAQDGEQQGSGGVQESTTRVGSRSVFAEHDDGQDDEGPETDDDGIEEEDDPDDDESLDEEIAQDENDANGDSDDEGESGSDPDDDGGHDEPHRRDQDEDDGTDNPGDESDDDGIEKTSSVAELQKRFGLSHLAGANYSLAEQDKLVREGDGKTARNRGDLNLTGTHYEAAGSTESPEDTLAFLF